MNQNLSCSMIKEFTDSFATIISSHKYIKHKNNILYQQGLPWLIGGSSRVVEYQKKQGNSPV